MKTNSLFNAYVTSGRLVAACILTLTGTSLGHADQAKSNTHKPPTAARTALAASAPVSKDIVADNVDGRLVSSPIALPRTAGALVPTPGAQTSAKPNRSMTTHAHYTATAGALAELGLDLLRQQSEATGNAQVNAVVSPLSLVSALGMIHAGTTGAGAKELATLLGTPAAGRRIYSTHLPQLLDRLVQPGVAGSPFVMANRVWLDAKVIASIPAAYSATVTDRYNADAAVLQFAQTDAARQTINQWVSQHTAQRIPELMPTGSITPTTQLVVTNAIHFKSKWAKPFDAAVTALKPFQTTPDGQTKPVPTMQDEREVRLGNIDNIMVIELPFDGDEFSLIVGVPPQGHSLNALETDLEGLDIASWSAQLKPSTCLLALPKFSIDPISNPLKASLQALGVHTIFGPDANFEHMLGQAGKSVMLDNVYQSATLIIDEQGGEAAAATGAAMMTKSFSPPAPVCAVDRPFVFAILHRATGVPLFLGKVTDPTQH